ncbi:MAG: hypothetical protein AAF939_04955 [Planctomycetota bacterium]
MSKILKAFFLVGLFCSVGCQAGQWGSVMNPSMMQESQNFWGGKFGEKAGLDDRAREIEERLGF